MNALSKTTLSLTVGLLMTPAFADIKEPNIQLNPISIKLQKRLDDTKMYLEDNNKRTETDLRGALKEEPAIDFGGGTATSQWTTIRGVGQNQIDLKVDNVYADTRLFRYQGRFVLDPTLTKVVGIQKGTGSASAGIGATSGAIVAKTIEAKELLKDSPNNFGAKINVGHASNDGRSYGVAAFGKMDDFDALVAVNINDEEDYKAGRGYKNIEGSDKVWHSQVKQKSVLAKVGFDANPDHRFTVSHRHEEQSGWRALREQYDMSQSRLRVDEDRGLTPPQRAMGYVLTNEFAGMNVRRNPAVKTFYVKNANGDYVSGDVGNRIADRTNTIKTTNLEWSGKNMGVVDYADANIYHRVAKRASTPEDLTGRPLVSGATLTTQGANVNLNTEFKPFGVFANGYLLKYGINYRKQTATPHLLAPNFQEQQKTDAGVYVEGITDIGQLTLTTGLRYDHFSIDKMMSVGRPKTSHGQFNPSIGLIYQATPDLSFKASHHYATRSPRLYEPSIAGGLSVNIINFAKNIKPETARTSEIGFDYQHDNLAVKGTYFWQNIKDVHGYQGDTRTMSDMANVGKLKNRGYEVNAGYRLNDLTARFGLAHSKPSLVGDLKDDGTLFSVETGRTWTTSLAYQVNPKLTVGWRGRLVEDAYTPTGQGGGQSISGITRKGYRLHDVFANYQPFVNDQFNVNVAVNNLTNENYTPHSQTATTNSLAGAGRDIRLGMNYTF